MSITPISDLNWQLPPSPCYVVDSRLLQRNAEIIASLRADVPKLKVLLALKGFAMWSVFPALRPYLDGCCASGPMEARLAHEEMGKEVHAYAPAFSDLDLAETLPYANHLVFNSPAQLRRHLPQLRAAARPPQVGLRINPEYAEVEVDLYNPCAPASRLGSTRAAIDADPGVIDLLDGLHLHVLCEQGAETLQRVVAKFEAGFADILRRVRWLNLGGGHWISKSDYNRELLLEVLTGLVQRYPNIEQLYIEPGEAWAVDSGVLVCQVEDIIHNTMPLAIVDISVTAHMPDVLEMPYRPTIHDAADAGVLPHTYRLGGLTCLAGDVIGDWSFAQPLAVGQRLVFADMSHYTMVKTTMFNGVRHPSIATWDGSDLRLIRRFDYSDYRNRLS